MTKSKLILRSISESSMRCRVAVLNLCLCRALLEEQGVDLRCMLLCEYFWIYVEGGIIEWYEMREAMSSILSVLDDETQSARNECVIATEIDSVARFYLFGEVGRGVEETTEIVYDVFMRAFPNRGDLLSGLCKLSLFGKDGLGLNHSRWEYLTFALANRLYASG